MVSPDPGRGRDRTARIAGVIAFVVAAIAVLVLLHRCRGSDGPVAGTAAARLAGASGVPDAAPNPRGEAIAAKFDREVDGSIVPGALTFKALKLYYPRDYAAYLRLMALRSGAQVPVAAFKTETQHWLATFMTEHRRDLVRSSDAMLLAVVHAQTAAAMALRTSSPTLCARYATTGFRPGDVTTNPQALAALDQANAARVLAMGFGQRRPARPEPTTMAPVDATAFAAGLTRLGASAAELDQMAAPSAAAAMAPERQCDLSIKMLQSIAALPTEQAGRVAAVIFQDPAKVR